MMSAEMIDLFWLPKGGRLDGHLHSGEGFRRGEGRGPGMRLIVAIVRR